MSVDFDEEVRFHTDGSVVSTARYQWDKQTISIVLLRAPEQTDVVVREGLFQNRAYWEAEDIGRRVTEAVKKMWGLSNDFD